MTKNLSNLVLTKLPISVTMKAGISFWPFPFGILEMHSKKQKAQQIAEILFKRIAAKNQNTLPVKFWNDERYARDYRLQLIKINALMKVYEPQAIINALLSPKGKNIWSITAPWLDPLIAEEQKRIVKLAEQKVKFEEPVNVADIPLDVVPKEKMTGPIKKKSVLEKLDE